VTIIGNTLSADCVLPLFQHTILPTFPGSYDPKLTMSPSESQSNLLKVTQEVLSRAGLPVQQASLEGCVQPPPI
jgi:hypothetical protein